VLSKQIMPTTIFFPCALLVMNSCGFASHDSVANNHAPAISPCFLSQRAAVNKVYFESPTITPSLNHKSCTSFSYDARTLQDSAASTSILNRPQASLLKPGLLDEHHNWVDAVPKKKNIYDNKFEFNDKRPPRDAKLISFYAVMRERCSPKNPDVQEKIEPGDIYAAKYYPGRSVYADQGYILNLEARIDLPELAKRQSGLLQLIAFVDTRAITMNQYNLADGLNHTTINTAGAGVNWTYVDNFEVKVYFANKLDDEVLAIAPALSHLFWIQAVKYY
jgi:hypothetical protein